MYLKSEYYVSYARCYDAMHLTFDDVLVVECIIIAVVVAGGGSRNDKKSKKDISRF